MNRKPPFPSFVSTRESARDGSAPNLCMPPAKRVGSAPDPTHPPPFIPIYTVGGNSSPRRVILMGHLVLLCEAFPLKTPPLDYQTASLLEERAVVGVRRATLRFRCDQPLGRPKSVTLRGSSRRPCHGARRTYRRFIVRPGLPLVLLSFLFVGLRVL